MATPERQIIQPPTQEELDQAPLISETADLRSNDLYKVTAIRQLQQRLTDGSKVLAEEVANLPDHLHALALTDLSEPFCLRIIPEDYTIVRIICNKKDAEQIEELLLELGLSVSTGHNTLSNAQDNTVVFQELSPSKVNALLIYQRLQEKKLDVTVTTSFIKPTNLLARLGTTFIASNPNLYKVTHSPTKQATGSTGHLIAEAEPPEEDKPAQLYRLDGRMESSLGPERANSFGPEVYTSMRAIGSLKEEDEKDRNKERLGIGRISYLVINPHILLKSKPPTGLPYTRYLLDNIAAISRSEDFIVKKDSMDNIVIIALQERASGYLERFGLGLHRGTDRQAHLRFETGNAKLNEHGEIEIEDYLPISELVAWSNLGELEPIYTTTNKSIESMQGTREQTTSRLKTIQIPGTNYVRILDVSREATYRVGGGPDRLIGQKEPLQELRQLTGATSPTKLTILKGQVGIGKSCLLDEYVKENPNCLALSIDPACEKLPGRALINIIEQLATIADSRIKDLEKAEKFKSLLAPLYEIHHASEATRLQKAQKDPNSLLTIIIGAINALEAIFGSFTFILDDLHHVDTHSDTYIMDLLERIANETSCHSVIAMRPEDRYQSIPQSSLESKLIYKYGSKAVATIWLEDEKTHKPKHNLREPQTARDYVFYSLPQEIRVNNATGEEKQLAGDWHLMLAEKIQTGLQFSSLINILLRNPQKYLVISENEIDLTPDAHQALSKISNQDDLLKHERARIRKLPLEHRTTLQLLAMVGTRLTTQKLVDIAEAATNKPRNEAMAIIDYLFSQSYLTKVVDPDGNPIGYEVQNEAIAQTARDSISQREKHDLVLKHYRRIANEPSIPDEIKFSWLQAATETTKISGQPKLWNEYFAKSQAVLKKAHEEREYSQGFSHASSILCNLDSSSKTDISKLLTELSKGPIITSGRPEAETKNIDNAIDLIKSALFSFIESGAHLGQFKRVHQAITLLENICVNTRKPEDHEDENLLQAYLIGFRMASIEESQIRNMDKREKMNEYHKKIRNLGHLYPGADLLAISMQYEARACDQGEPENVVEQLGNWLRKFDLNQEGIQAIAANNPEAYARIKLLYQRYLYEHTIRKPQTRLNIDDDAQIDPTFFTVEETNIMMEDLRKELDALYQQRQANPLLFNDPIEEIAFLELIGLTYGYCGEYERAEKALDETWLLANKLNVPRSAARAAKFKADMQLMRATTYVTYPTTTSQGMIAPKPNSAINRTAVIQAINTCNDECLQMVKTVDGKDLYHVLGRTVKIRAIAILLQTYDQELIVASAHPNRAKELKRIKEETLPYIREALRDFEYMNSTQYEEDFLEDPEGEYSYYITSQMGHILDFISQLGIRNEEINEDQGEKSPIKVPNFEDLISLIEEFPALQGQVIINGIIRIQSKQHTDHAGEVDRKLEGYRKLVKLGREIELRTNTRANLEAHHSNLIKESTSAATKEANSNVYNRLLVKIPDWDTIEGVMAAITADHNLTTFSPSGP